MNIITRIRIWRARHALQLAIDRAWRIKQEIKIERRYIEELSMRKNDVDVEIFQIRERIRALGGDAGDVFPSHGLPLQFNHDHSKKKAEVFPINSSTYENPTWRTK